MSSSLGLEHSVHSTWLPDVVTWPSSSPLVIQPCFQKYAVTLTKSQLEARCIYYITHATDCHCGTSDKVADAAAAGDVEGSLSARTRS
jgi:hypothetical protein